MRLEVGPRDLQSSTCKLVVRRSGEKVTCEEAQVRDVVTGLMKKIQQEMYNKASEEMARNMVVAHNWDDFCKFLDEGKVCLIF